MDNIEKEWEVKSSSTDSVLTKATKAFLEMKEEDSLSSAKSVKNVSIKAAGRAFYAALDWIIAGGLGVMVVWMNVRGFSIATIFMATWAYDFVAAAGFYLLSDMSGYDITLGNSFRRAIDVICEKSFFLGALMLVGLSIKAIIWEGPEVICFLFKKEIGSPVRMFLSLLILSALQGVFGSWLYTTGYVIWNKIF